MNRFLAGFTDELLKVAGPWGAPDGVSSVPRPPPPGGIVRPPSTGVPGAPPPKPPNAMGAPGGSLLGAIPTQKMESPAKNAPQGWRPSPGYRPSKAGDPTPPGAPPKKRGGGGGGGDPGVPWETAPQRMTRVIGEKAYNQKFDANNAPGRKVTVDGKQVNSEASATGSGKQLAQADADARKQRMTAARAGTAVTKSRAEAAYNAPENKTQRWADAQRDVGEIRDGRMGGRVQPAPKRGPVTVDEKVERLKSSDARRAAAPAPRVRPSASVAGRNSRWD